MQMAHSIITKAFSPAVIIAGVTTCDDVRWWMREEILKLGLAAGFHPSFSIHRRGAAGKLSGNTVIVPCSFSTMNSAVFRVSSIGLRLVQCSGFTVDYVVLGLAPLGFGDCTTLVYITDVCPLSLPPNIWSKH
jgi:hypothetical protein